VPNFPSTFQGHCHQGFVLLQNPTNAYIMEIHLSTIFTYLQTTMHLAYPQNFVQPFFSSISLETTVISRTNWLDLTENAKFRGVNKVHRL